MDASVRSRPPKPLAIHRPRQANSASRLHDQPGQREPDQPQRPPPARAGRRRRRRPAAAAAARARPRRRVTQQDQRRRRPGGARFGAGARRPPPGQVRTGRCSVRYAAVAVAGAVDVLVDPRGVAVAQLGQVGSGRAVGPGRQDVDGDVVGQRRHLLDEPVPAGDLERDQPHLPRPARHRRAAARSGRRGARTLVARPAARPGRPGCCAPGRRRRSARRRSGPAAAAPAPRPRRAPPG